MSRVFFQYVLPLIAPTLVYMAWLWWWNRHRDEEERKRFFDGPWYWALVFGALCAVASVLTFGLSGTTPANSGVYVPPHMENGQIVPGRVVPYQDVEAPKK